MKLIKELSELVASDVISQKTADDITAYYLNKKNAQPSRITITFGIIGACLISLGILLILAHN